MVPKLVRDKVPQRIVGHGARPRVYNVPADGIATVLLAKLHEETSELHSAVLHADDGLTAPHDDVVEGMADVMEVLVALCRCLRIKTGRINIRMDVKRSELGGFDCGTLLCGVDENSPPEGAEPDGKDDRP